MFIINSRQFYGFEKITKRNETCFNIASKSKLINFLWSIMQLSCKKSENEMPPECNGDKKKTTYFL